MNENEIRYLISTIKNFIENYYFPEAIHDLDSLNINWCKAVDLDNPPENSVCIPTDYNLNELKKEKLEVCYGATKLVFWNLVPEHNHLWSKDVMLGPVWYRHINGAITPAWDFAGTLFKLLTLFEEQEILERDKHGRFLGKFSPRAKYDLLSRPIFNDAIASLMQLSLRCKENSGVKVTSSSGIIKAPRIFLSHDIDIIYGNEFWTQMSRFGRIFTRPLSLIKIIQQLKFIVINQFYPKRYYWNELIQMMALEKHYGFDSMVYFLNGTRGRYAARANSADVHKLNKALEHHSMVGIHYNYDTYLDPASLKKQKQELEGITSRNIKFGRSHYLMFNQAQSWSDFCFAGIEVDESLGYSDRVGFRSGVAGVIRPFNPLTQEIYQISSIPLAMMESTFLSQYKSQSFDFLEELFIHIKEVGGAVSILWHPGQFNNPEYPEAIGAYEMIIKLAYKHGFVSGYQDYFAKDSFLKGL